MAAKRGKNKDSTIYEVTFFGPQTFDLEGTIKEENKNVIKITHKKMRSSKFVTTVLNKNDENKEILSITGKEGSAGSIRYVDRRAPYRKKVSGHILPADDGNENFITIEPENGDEIVRVKPENCEIVGDDREATEKAKANRQQQKNNKSNQKTKSSQSHSRKKSEKKGSDDW